MRLVLNGKVNSLYVQSLCMMFFRGEKFQENELNPRGVMIVTSEEKENGIFCTASVTYDSLNENASCFVNYDSHIKYERISKIAVGKAIYEACVKLTGYIPPWGLLTGIRPSLVAAELIKEYGEEKAVEFLQAQYLLSKQKASLAVSVAKNESLILDKYDEDTCSLYVSIPFCPTRCSYCSFISYATNKLLSLIPDYVEKLVVEIEKSLQLIKELKLSLVSIYIGGGTPTTLDEQQLERILSVIHKFTYNAPAFEFTVEGGRPDTITKAKLDILKKYGVNRISINPQTLNDDVLKGIGRRHTVDDFFKAYQLAHDTSFNVINTDLIAGLDGDNFDSFKKTIDKIVELEPNNVTVHSFSVKKSAQILRDDKNIYNRDGIDAVRSVDYSYEMLISKGYIPYYMYRQKNTISDLENVGYAKPEAFGVYNVLMMGDGHTVFGVGAGATTKLVKKTNSKKEILRIFSPKYPYEYLQDNKDNSYKIIDFLKGGSDSEDN